MHIIKGGIQMRIIDSKSEWKLRDPNRYPMPCGHFGGVVMCTCRIRDWRCQTCGAVFVGMDGGKDPETGKKIRDVFQVVDPHAKATR